MKQMDFDISVTSNVTVYNCCASASSASVYVNRSAGKTSTVPRHREINHNPSQAIQVPCTLLSRISS